MSHITRVKKNEVRVAFGPVKDNLADAVFEVFELANAGAVADI
jgi:hypothetical protein